MMSFDGCSLFMCLSTSSRSNQETNVSYELVTRIICAQSSHSPLIAHRCGQPYNNVLKFVLSSQKMQEQHYLECHNI